MMKCVGTWEEKYLAIAKKSATAKQEKIVRSARQSRGARWLSPHNDEFGSLVGNSPASSDTMKPIAGMYMLDNSLGYKRLQHSLLRCLLAIEKQAVGELGLVSLAWASFFSAACYTRGDLEVCLLGTDPEHSCVESNFVPRMERNEDLKIIKVSRFVILSEMLRCLNGDVCARECEHTVNGYSSYVKVRVPVSSTGFETVELVGNSRRFFSTEVEAIESAAENLICSLKDEFKLEVDDVNWSAKNESELKRADIEDCVERLNKENSQLKEFITSLVDGWALSLQLADSVYKMSVPVCRCVRFALDSVYNMLDVSRAVSNTEVLRDHARFVWSEGVSSFDTVSTRRESLYKP